jgi:hypothetical protein
MTLMTSGTSSAMTCGFWSSSRSMSRKDELEKRS